MARRIARWPARARRASRSSKRPARSCASPTAPSAALVARRLSPGHRRPARSRRGARPDRRPRRVRRRPRRATTSTALAPHARVSAWRRRRRSRWSACGTLVALIRRRFPDSDVRLARHGLPADEAAADRGRSTWRASPTSSSSSAARTATTRASWSRRAAAHCARVHHVQSESDVRPEWLDGADAVGLTAGTSTPDRSHRSRRARSAPARRGDESAHCGVPVDEAAAFAGAARWLIVAAFAVAMAWVEAACVYYLRVLVDRIDPVPAESAADPRRRSARSNSRAKPPR